MNAFFLSLSHCNTSSRCEIIFKHTSKDKKKTLEDGEQRRLRMNHTELFVLFSIDGKRLID